MGRLSQKQKAISEINREGILLVFPVNNRKEPSSLWSRFYPRSPMKWEWDDEGDDRVASLWHLMKELSDCREVVYSKWYQGRATFFSRDLFRALLKNLTLETDAISNLSAQARQALEVLDMDSPLSTRDLKKQLELQGKENEGNYKRATQDLFSRLLTVGFGETEDGSFPSLLMGSTRLIYEDLWGEAATLSPEKARETLTRFMPEGSLTRRHLEKIRNSIKNPGGRGA